MRKRKQIHLKNFNYNSVDYVYFLTLCTANKDEYFINKKLAEEITKELRFRRDNKEINLYCYCVMPNHLHVLVSLNNFKSLQSWVSSFKRYAAKFAFEQYNIKPLWQRNFYDHVVRKNENLLKIAEYIVNNPVRKGLVFDWQKYAYSKIVNNLPV